MLKRSLLFGIGMAASVVPCWPDTALAKDCQVIVNPQVVPPKVDDILSKLPAVFTIVKTFYDLGKNPKDIDFGALGDAATKLWGVNQNPDITMEFEILKNQLHDISVNIYVENLNERNMTIVGQIANWEGIIDGALLSVSTDAGQRQTIPRDSAPDFDSKVAITEAFEPFYWRRAWDPTGCTYNTTDSRWMSVISPPTPTSEGPGISSSVYEWRYMVPYILRAIPNRLQVIAGVDPDWGINGHYDKSDLKYYATHLSEQLSNMRGGVQCATRERLDSHLGVNNSLTTKAACADIYTGLSQYEEYHGSLPPTSDSSFPKKLAALRGDHAGQAQRFFPGAESWVIQRMPLFEMKSVVDALHYYMSHAPDLTEARHRIPLAGAPNLCLQDGGDSNPVVMASCSGINNTQKWQYDRATGQIYNNLGPLTNNHGRCLTIPNKVQPIPDTRVVSKKCGDGDTTYQKWTYDPTLQRLSNEFGTVLATDGQRVYLDYFYDSQASSWSQSWLADVPLQRVICGRSDPVCGN
jgi:hypothetical protein